MRWRGLNGRINAGILSTVWHIVNYSSRLQQIGPKSGCCTSNALLLLRHYSGRNGGSQLRGPCCVYIPISRRDAWLCNELQLQNRAFCLSCALAFVSKLSSWKRNVNPTHVSDQPGRSPAGGQTRTVHIHPKAWMYVIP